MVAIDIAQWEREKKSARLNADGLSQYDMELIGRAVRIELPMTDPRTLSTAADLLRGLANTIEFTLQRQDLPLRARLQMIKDETTVINRRIRDKYEQGKF